MNDDNAGTAQTNTITLNPYGFDPSSPLNHDNRPYTPGMQFDMQNEVQKSKMRYSGLVGTSLLTTASGNVATASTSIVNVSLSPNQRANMNMAIPFLTVCEGTAFDANFEIFPAIGGSIAGNKFFIQEGFDYSTWSSNSLYPAHTAYSVSIYNNNAGTTANLFVEVQWKFVANNTGGQL